MLPACGLSCSHWASSWAPFPWALASSLWVVGPPAITVSSELIHAVCTPCRLGSASACLACPTSFMFAFLPPLLLQSKRCTATWAWPAPRSAWRRSPPSSSAHKRDPSIALAGRCEHARIQGTSAGTCRSATRLPYYLSPHPAVPCHRYLPPCAAVAPLGWPLGEGRCVRILRATGRKLPLPGAWQGLDIDAAAKPCSRLECTALHASHCRPP